MKGPCLCGDPYCGSCGDPSLLAEEGAIDELIDVMRNNGATIDHYKVLIHLVPKLIAVINEVVNDVVQDRMAGDQQYIDYLKERIHSLEMEQVYEEARER
jgi:hypothetical protein